VSPWNRGPVTARWTERAPYGRARHGTALPHSERLRHNGVVSAKEELRRLVEDLPEASAAQLLHELALRSDLNHAEEQLARGEFNEYDQDTIRDLADAVKRRGQERLAARA
jgi:hypothetical protein